MILRERIELLLAQAAHVIGATRASFIKELRFSLRSNHSKERPHHVLQDGIGVNRGTGLKGRSGEVREVVEVDRGPGEELVRAIGVHIADFDSEFEHVLSSDPAHVIAHRVGATEPLRAVSGYQGQTTEARKPGQGEIKPAAKRIRRAEAVEDIHALARQWEIDAIGPDAQVVHQVLIEH